MRTNGRVASLILSLSIVAAVGADAHASDPVVYSIVEGRDTASGLQSLVVLGKSVSRYREFELRDKAGVPVGVVTRSPMKNRAILVLLLQSHVPAGDYVLVCRDRKGAEWPHSLSLSYGEIRSDSIEDRHIKDTLRQELDDADALQGRSAAYFENATNLRAGTLSTDLFSAIQDLVAENRVGSSGGQVASGDHHHDGRYALQLDLSSIGTINSSTNAVDWTRLKNVPPGLADGVDDDLRYTAGPGLTLQGSEFGVSFGGSGVMTNAARSDHDHDAQYASGGHSHDSLYATRTELGAPGTLNDSANPVAWSRLKGVPMGFADGTDDDTQYAAGAGLVLANQTFAISFAGTGSLSSASRSDHDHDASYYTKSTLDSGGTINSAANPVIWSRLKGVPSGLADGTDNDTTYAAGSGLSLSGGSFSVSFGGDGTASNAARSDHAHGAQYVARSGDTMSGGLTVSINGAGTAISGLNAATTTSGTVGVRGQGNTGIYGAGGDQGVYGSGNVGVWGDTDGNGGTRVGVVGRCSVSNGVAAVQALVSGVADGVPALIANHASTNGGDLARFQRNGVTRATIDAGGGATFSGAGSFVGLQSARNSSQSAALGVSNSLGTGISVTGSVGLEATGAPWGVSCYGSQYGVYARSGNNGYGDAVHGVSNRGNGVYGNTTDLGAGVFAEATSQFGSALVANLSASTGGGLAVFMTQGNSVARIDRNGKGYFNGGTQSSGADFAESVEVRGPKDSFEPGDVLVVDTAGVRRFALSSEAESTLVAGVYSTKPALLGTLHDVASDDSRIHAEVPLGIVGICPTKVCDEGGPIRAGDLLVTASIAGHAKKAPDNPRQGSVLGKALGRLDAGRGRIEVLISLQ